MKWILLSNWRHPRGRKSKKETEVEDRELETQGKLLLETVTLKNVTERKKYPSFLLFFLEIYCSGKILVHSPSHALSEKCKKM